MFDSIRELFVETPQRLLPWDISRGIEEIRGVVARNRREERKLRLAQSETGSTADYRAKPASSADGTADIRFRRSYGAAELALFRKEYDAAGERIRRPPDLSAKNLTFSALLLRFVKDKCGGAGPVAYKRAGVDRRRYSRIISDNNASADKETVMRFAIGLQLTRAEADRLMSAAGYSFSLSIPTDCVFLYCIDHGIWNIEDVDELLAAVR